MMGYPDQALAANQAMEANARRRGHPFDLAFALTLGAQLFRLSRRFRCAAATRAEEAERIGQERGIALLGEIMAEISRGVAWLRAGAFGRSPAAARPRHRAIDADRASDLDLVSQGAAR